MVFAANSLPAFSRWALNQRLYATSAKKIRALIYEESVTSGCRFSGGASSHIHIYLPDQNLIFRESLVGYQVMDVNSSKIPEVYRNQQKSFHKVANEGEAWTVELLKEVEISASSGARLKQLAVRIRELQTLQEKLEEATQKVHGDIEKACYKILDKAQMPSDQE